MGNNNLSTLRKIHIEASKVVNALGQYGLNDIYFTCTDKKVEESYRKQARAQELAKALRKGTI